MNEPNEMRSPELARLIAAERAAGQLPAPARARIWEGIESSLLLPPVSPGPSVGRALRRALLSRGAVAAVSVALGGVGGMKLQAHRDQLSQLAAPVPVTVVAPAAPTPVSPPLTAPAPPPPPTKTVARVREPAPVLPSNKPTTEAQSALSRERTAIDTARTALARGDAKGALQLLVAHAHDFPAGAFAEEAAALRIQALLRSGAEPEAREAAAEFRAKYPRSLILPALEQSLKPAP
jgi:hypothetical protein